MWKYFACLVALRAIAPLPLRLGYLVSRIIADLSFLLSPKAKAGITSNALHSLGPKASQASINHVTLEVFRNTARNFYDILTLPRFNLPSVERNVSFHGWHHFEEAVDRGKGVILTSIHMGNMDTSVQVIRKRSVKLTVLSEVIEPWDYYHITRRLREWNGISMLPVTFSGLKEAITRLKRGEIVAIACDRAIQGSGIVMEFLGEKALMPVGGVELALRTGSPIVPAAAIRLSGYRSAFFFEPAIYVDTRVDRNIVIRETLKKILRSMEVYIRKYPDQWMVFNPIWDGKVVSSNGKGVIPGRAEVTPSEIAELVQITGGMPTGKIRK